MALLRTHSLLHTCLHVPEKFSFLRVEFSSISGPKIIFLGFCIFNFGLIKFPRFPPLLNQYLFITCSLTLSSSLMYHRFSGKITTKRSSWMIYPSATQLLFRGFLLKADGDMFLSRNSGVNLQSNNY